MSNARIEKKQEYKEVKIDSNSDEKKENNLNSVIAGFKKFHSKPIEKVFEDYLKGGEAQSLELSIRCRRLVDDELEKNALSLWINQHYATYLKNPEKLNGLSAKACVILGWIFTGGIGVTKNDKIAWKFFEAAAQQKEAYALVLLGNRYLLDNRKKGLAYFKQALALGSIQAFHLLARHDLIDNAKIKENYLESARAGYSLSYYYLGILAHEVEANDQDAYRYFKEGASRGCPYSMWRLGSMEEHTYMRNKSAADCYRLAVEHGVPINDLLSELYSWLGLALIAQEFTSVEDFLFQRFQNEMDPYACYQLGFALRQSKDDKINLFISQKLTTLEEIMPGMLNQLNEAIGDSETDLVHLVDRERINVEIKASKELQTKKEKLYLKFVEEKEMKKNFMGSILTLFSKTKDQIKLIERAEEGEMTCVTALKQLEQKK